MMLFLKTTYLCIGSHFYKSFFNKYLQTTATIIEKKIDWVFWQNLIKYVMDFSKKILRYNIKSVTQRQTMYLPTLPIKTVPDP